MNPPRITMTTPAKPIEREIIDRLVELGFFRPDVDQESLRFTMDRVREEMGIDIVEWSEIVTRDDFLVGLHRITQALYIVPLMPAMKQRLAHASMCAPARLMRDIFHACFLADHRASELITDEKKKQLNRRIDNRIAALLQQAVRNQA